MSTVATLVKNIIAKITKSFFAVIYTVYMIVVLTEGKSFHLHQWNKWCWDTIGEWCL